MSSALIGSRGPWHASDHSRHRGYVMTGAGEVWEAIVVLDDPPMYVAGHDTCVPTISTVFDLPIDQCVFPNKLLSNFVDLPLLGF